MSDDRMSASEVLAQKGYVVISTSGRSMMPMLRDRRDTVEIRTVTGDPKKYDVVLYRRGNELVLHRIIRVLPDSYIIRGDNCVNSERVAPEALLGRLFSFTRNGKRRTVNSASYIIYSHLTVALHPVKTFLGGILRGIAKNVKRILR